MIRLRCRSWIRSRRSAFVLIFIMSGPSWKSLRACLPRLLLQDFARIADTLLFVRVRLAQTADVGRDLTDELSIDAGDREMRLLVDDDIDAHGNVEHDGVRVAERKN